LIGYLSVQWIPLRLVPYTLALYPLLLAAATYSLLLLPRFRTLIDNDIHRLGITVFVAIMPHGQVYLVSNTTYSLWNLLLLLLLFTLAPAAKSWQGRTIELTAMILAAVSTPLSIVAVPVFVFNLFRHKGDADRIRNSILIVVVVLYVAIGTQSAGLALLSNLLARIEVTWLYFLQRVVAESVLGYNLRLALFQGGQLWIIYTAAMTICIGLAVIIDRRYQRFQRESFINLGILLYYLGAITFLSVISRQLDPVSHMGAWNIRYFYVQHVFFWLFVGIIITKAVDWQQTVRPVKALVLSLVFVYAIWMAYEQRPIYQTSYSEGRVLATFLANVESTRAILTPGERADFHLDRNGFNIYLRYTGK
jgi:hypothetical protein